MTRPPMIIHLLVKQLFLFILQFQQLVLLPYEKENYVNTKNMIYFIFEQKNKNTKENKNE
jgi:hypothetical protein